MFVVGIDISGRRHLQLVIWAEFECGYMPTLADAERAPDGLCLHISCGLMAHFHWCVDEDAVTKTREI